MSHLCALMLCYLQHGAPSHLCSCSLSNLFEPWFPTFWVMTTICILSLKQYASKTACMNLAPYMLLDKQLSLGNKNLCSMENNSSTNLFEHPCVVHIFINVNVAASLVHHALVQSGMQTFCKTSKPSIATSSLMLSLGS